MNISVCSERFFGIPLSERCLNEFSGKQTLGVSQAAISKIEPRGVCRGGKGNFIFSVCFVKICISDCCVDAYLDGPKTDSKEKRCRTEADPCSQAFMGRYWKVFASMHL